MARGRARIGCGSPRIGAGVLGSGARECSDRARGSARIGRAGVLVRDAEALRTAGVIAEQTPAQTQEWPAELPDAETRDDGQLRPSVGR